MTESTIKAVLPRDIKRVWDTVTSLDHYEWRGDLDRIEIQDDKTFIEHTKSGYSTVFTVTACIPMERWEFDMENDNIRTADIRTVGDGKGIRRFLNKIADR